MELTQQQARYYIEEAFREGKPSMVHGTSVEAAIQLLEGGMKNPSKSHPRYEAHPISNGYLFFIPRKASFVEHPLHSSIILDLDGTALENMVQAHASRLQQETFLIDLLGSWPEEDPESFPHTITMERLAEEGINTERIETYGITKLAKEIKKRKGVIITLNDRALSLPIEDGRDEPGKEVMIPLPNGLERQYLHYIYSCGELEERALNTYIESLQAQ